MFFGRKADTVATDTPEPATNGDGTVSLRSLQAQLDAHEDEFRYMKQRFSTLQARLMAELRELRRALDSFEPVEGEEESDAFGE